MQCHSLSFPDVKFTEITFYPFPAEPHRSVSRAQDLRTGGCWFNPWLNKYSFQGLMIVVVTGLIPLLLLSIVSTRVMLESSQRLDWLVVLGFNATLTAMIISWRLGSTCVSWLSHTSTNTTFFPKPPTTFLTCFSRGERRKYVGKKVHLHRVSKSQPPGHESDTLSTEPAEQGQEAWKKYSLEYWLKEFLGSMERCTGLCDENGSKQHTIQLSI